VYTLLHPYTPVPSNPDPDYNVAQFVVDQVDGKIVQAGDVGVRPDLLFNNPSHTHVGDTSNGSFKTITLSDA
jgi:hypothetical protein